MIWSGHSAGATLAAAYAKQHNGEGVGTVVAISSQLDEAVTPISSSQWDSPDAQNIILQDGCSADLSEHLGITFSPRTIALVANALGSNVDVSCAPVAAFFDSGINDNQGIPPESLDAV